MSRTSKRPNIVFLLNDHQAYYRHGWDGGPVVQRPRFEEFASQGVEFERAYTAAPLCGPARRTILTGVFPHRHGEVKNDMLHPYDLETYLDVLQERGYAQHYFGKWHAGPGTAYDHGCEGFSYPSYNNPYTKEEYAAYLKTMELSEPEILIEKSFGLVQEGIHYRQQSKWSNECAAGTLLTPTATHEAFFLAHLARGKLEEIREGGEERPFSLRVDFWGPHQPYFPSTEYAEMYDPAAIPPYGNFDDPLDDKPEVYLTEANRGISRDGRLIRPNPLPWSDWQIVLARCYAQITLVDAAAGVVLDALDALELSENTLVIWTTDHGDAVACHGGHFDKASYMPEEVIRIPLAIRFPSVIAPAQRRRELVSNVDLGPTIVDAAGGAYRHRTDGESLLGLATDADRTWREAVVSETHGHGEDVMGRALVRDRLKYVWYEDIGEELYDLYRDPYELHNLVANPAYRATLEELRAGLVRWRRDYRDDAP